MFILAYQSLHSFILNSFFPSNKAKSSILKLTTVLVDQVQPVVTVASLNFRSLSGRGGKLGVLLCVFDQLL